MGREVVPLTETERRVRRSTRASGVPERVDDPATAALVARIAARVVVEPPSPRRLRAVGNAP